MPDHETFVVPLIVAVTGHRDLVADEIPGLRERVRSLLEDLVTRYPERRLQVVTALAEGADRLVADVAIELGVAFTVLLPMPREVYIEDFAEGESRARFESLCAAAEEVLELPVAKTSTREEIAVAGPARNRQYAQLGVFLCAHCHILLALWDGKVGTELGGTGQVVKFHHDDIMPGYTTKSVATQQMLVDDESDLVYHIVCSRERREGEPRTGLQPLEWCWFTKDRERPRSPELPRQHQMIFERTSEFSRDASRFAAQIDAGKYPLIDDGAKEKLPSGVEEIDRVFCIADWLAIHYQKRSLLALRVTHLLAFFMGVMFILYSDIEIRPIYMVLFLVFFLVSAAVQQFAKRLQWNRKYLDYRTLAEGLRVQFYWAAAGVSSERESKFTHDNFLQTQDPELGWIRNVMRVAGTRCDLHAEKSAAGLDFVLNEWIGDAGSGQLGYFASKSADRIRRNRRTEALGLVSLVISVAVVVLLVVAGQRVPEGWVGPLMMLMGTLLLLFGIRQGYAYATAEKDLIKQYEFMLRIFHNARRRLDNADDPVEQRQILLALGGSALDEHAEWILMHRDRAIDQGEIWRMGS